MKSETVILLHGLGESSLAMASIEFILRQARYEVHNLDCPYREMDIETLVEGWLAPVLEKFRFKRTVHFVTHSLGGILVRRYLENRHLLNLGRVVMLAPPHHGSPIFNLYRRNPWFVRLVGPPAAQCGTDEKSYMRGLMPTASHPFGIIAGSLSYDPLSTVLMPFPHDGRVTVESTRLPGMGDHIVLPSGHELIPSNPLALSAILRFLKTGSFKADENYRAA